MQSGFTDYLYFLKFVEYCRKIAFFGFSENTEERHDSLENKNNNGHSIMIKMMIIIMNIEGKLIEKNSIYF